MKEFKTIFGTRITAAGCGGAALNPIVHRFLQELFGGFNVSNGYGTTGI